MIPVKVEQVFLSNVGFVVLLKGEQDERSLPIFIGPAEAQAIAIHTHQVQIPRPLTHDLLKNLLDYLECRLMRIEICDLKEGTFYARLALEKDGRGMEMDCRPSDAIALAVRCGAPILVHENVMNEAGRVIEAPVEGKPAGEEKTASFAEPKAPRPLSPLDILNRQLDKAVKEERYEDAAKLRDEIKGLKDKHTGN